MCKKLFSFKNFIKKENNKTKKLKAKIIFQNIFFLVIILLYF